MKTTVYMMNDAERAARATTKALHQAMRAELRAAHHGEDGRRAHRHRYAILAWGFLRGLPYRRFERSHCIQDLGGGRTHEHNMPSLFDLAKALAAFLPEVAADLDKYHIKRGAPTETRLAAWFADPSGAIPAPAPRVKRPYPEAVAAE